MTNIKEIEKLNFKITWKLLYLGFSGSNVFANQLLASDIIDYAIEQLENSDCDDIVCELAGEYNNNTENISNLLKKLAEKEKSDENLELRKWQSIIVAKEIENKNKNPIEGLINLGDIWIHLDFPEDSPHIFQGRNNNITPMQYYTDENYNKIYENHQRWLKNEIDFIIKNQ